MLWWRILVQKHKWQLLAVTSPVKAQKIWSILPPPHSIHSSIHFFHSVSVLKKACCQKCKDSPPVFYNTTITERHFLFFLLCTDLAVLYSEWVNMWCKIQYKHCGQQRGETGAFGGPDVRCHRKEKVRVWLSSQSLLKQSPVSEDAEYRHKVSIAAPLGAYTCLSTSILDRKEEHGGIWKSKGQSLRTVTDRSGKGKGKKQNGCLYSTAYIYCQMA